MVVTVKKKRMCSWKMPDSNGNLGEGRGNRLAQGSSQGNRKRGLRGARREAEKRRAEARHLQSVKQRKKQKSAGHASWSRKVRARDS